MRIAYEALAWGRYVDDYRRAWRIVELADHPAVGVCLDSFHILSRGHDPAAIEEIPGEKIFFLQLADAPALTMDVLSWSRHHRLFPGEGAFDLGRVPRARARAGYAGPLSLEVFNDAFRQTDVLRTARQAKRSLTWLEDQVARRPLRRGAPTARPLPDVGQPAGFDFVEIKAEDAGEVDVMLRQLGFTFRGRHRSKPVRLWTQGTARVRVQRAAGPGVAPTLAAVGFEVPTPAPPAPGPWARRAAGLPPHPCRGAGPAGVPGARRHRGLPRRRRPEGDAAWVPEFEGGDAAPANCS